jgi:hypothetical protein
MAFEIVKREKKCVEGVSGDTVSQRHSCAQRVWMGKGDERV